MTTSTSPSINWDQMQYDYYKINPYPHAEVAYQPKQGDLVPPVSALTTTTGPSGILVVLFTTLYNKPASSGNCQAEVLDHNLLLKYNGGAAPDATRTKQLVEQHQDVCAARPAGIMPSLFVLYVKPNTPYAVSTLVPGTQVKLLSKEQYVANGGMPPI